MARAILDDLPDDGTRYELLEGVLLVTPAPSFVHQVVASRNLRARKIGWRLDYMLASPAMMARATSCAVQADVGTSDHAPVVMTTV